MATNKTNRGKDFEEQIRMALNAVPSTVVERLHDQMSGYKGSSNVCDFIAYHYPNMYYFECKCCYGNTLPFSNITETQWDGLLERSPYPGVVAGYFIWFIDHDITYFVSADSMQYLKQHGCKSFHVTKSPKMLEGTYYIVPGKKRRVFFDYNLKEFIGE